MSAEAIFSVSGLTKRFGEGEAEVLVLKGIDLSMAAGEMAALLGPSGSGKSTLLTILGTLMRASGGTHDMLGVDLMQASEGQRTKFRSKHLGFVFQFHHLLPDLSALENVMMPAACAAGRETRAMRERATELLDAVGLADRRDYRPSAMSGGQRQRVAVARALINNPVLVLADEPTGNLDRQSADHVMDLIRSINQTMATSFLISTHDEHIAGQCPRRIELLDGRIVRS
ncbi:Lipoprotein-releasing system ATP-binding protein lolD 2 [Sphingobium indicum BiD32]|uniref:Lipoprotein-releasing system ATP-binding protein lolD 2 n=1 Tax=Sphingobium indicum BiD32 TaxID=1301087 RepID=N1MMC5_9SPHN|nr:ABC transporter ATP-binding protein [Sphingobium indicum]MBA3053775.1 ABC transporter ATP-binding protein [Sphingomonadales bacterium]MBU3991414.1 ABC transporter ATP-binding protein [Alphaproteobacteria bacterium]CCW16742.1 Lipoprotein-releasing system ATP-binding protein lolD 2 [Sphingobium indicum BiD32]